MCTGVRSYSSGWVVRPSGVRGPGIWTRESLGRVRRVRRPVGGVAHVAVRAGYHLSKLICVVN
eukprot:2568166-Prymnesium_polylepis.1